jgi:hypothetical protein
MKRWILALAGGLVALATGAGTAHAIPAFARKYRVSCSQCHAPVPRLNEFGELFAGNGFEFAIGEEPRDTLATGDPLLRLQSDIPLAVRFDMYVRAQNEPKGGQNALDFQVPWGIKLLTGGQVADRISYYMYFYLSERGEVAGLEDAYIQFTNVANSGVSFIVGQFQVSDPLFKRELRLEYEDYQPYRVRVGNAVADLTYDRGIMALWSPRSGTDVAFEVVSGRGLNHADDNKQYDGDDQKSTALRISQDVGPIRIGGFAYRGYEVASGAKNTITMVGPDVTLPLGGIGELNAQYMRRVDRDPFFGQCSIAAPCPGNRTVPFETTVNSAFAEAIIWPEGPTGRLFFTALYNWIDSDDPVISLRLGEQNDAVPFLAAYQTASAGVHYLYRRNVRLLGELGWDVEREQARFVLGSVIAF